MRSKASGTSSASAAPAPACLGHDYEALLARASDRPPPDGDDDDLATLNFSGGTTGAPKATMLRHRNLVTVARNTIQVSDRRRRRLPERAAAVADRAGDPDVAPVGGRDGGARRPLRGGRAGALIERSGATRTSLVPTQLAALPGASAVRAMIGSRGWRRSTSAAHEFRPWCSSARSRSSARRSACCTA